MTLRELAERLGCRLEGDGDLEIRRVASLDQAGEGDVAFFANPKYAPALRRTRATAVIVGEDAPPVSRAVTYCARNSGIISSPSPIRKRSKKSAIGSGLKYFIC